jgi:hypothetical protein
MPHYITEALIDSARALPFLLVIYFAIEFVEYRFGKSLRARISGRNPLSPFVAALLGCIPQCGFSVVGSTLYVRRLVTVGTLLAIFLSTSDEAVPVILAQPGHAHMIAPLFATKIIIAVVFGYAADALISRRRTAGAPQPAHEAAGCCGHHVGRKVRKRELILHPLRHTATVFVFLFLASAGINAAIEHVGEANLHSVLLGRSLWQPVIAALVGLIPNCAASVAITQLYIKGGIGFGSTIAGLSASAGLGLLVLIKENRPFKDTLRIIALLLAVSIGTGILIQLVYN